MENLGIEFRKNDNKVITKKSFNRVITKYAFELSTHEIGYINRHENGLYLIGYTLDKTNMVDGVLLASDYFLYYSKSHDEIQIFLEKYL